MVVLKQGPLAACQPQEAFRSVLRNVLRRAFDDDGTVAPVAQTATTALAQTCCASPSAVPALTAFPVFLIFSRTSPYPSSGPATTSTFCVSRETSYDLTPVRCGGQLSSTLASSRRGLRRIGWATRAA